MSKNDKTAELPRAPFHQVFLEAVTEADSDEERDFAAICYGIFRGLDRFVLEHGAEHARLQLAAMLAGQTWLLKREGLAEFFRKHTNALDRLIRSVIGSHEAAQMAAHDSLYAVSEGRAYPVLLNTVAPEILKIEKVPDDPDTRGKLAAAVSQHGRELYEYLGRRIPVSINPEPRKLEIEKGILAMDEHFAAYLEDIGDKGKEGAARVRKEAAERVQKYNGDQTAFNDSRYMPGPGSLWTLWIDFTGEQKAPRYLKVLSTVVLCDVVQPNLERIARRAKKNPPALAMVVHESVVPAFSRGYREEEVDGQRLLTFEEKKIMRVSTMASSAISVLVDKGIKLFPTVTAHRLLRWQIQTGHSQAFEGNPDPRLIRVEGGYKYLTCDILGLHSSKAKEIEAIIEAEHHTEIPVPGGTWGKLLNRAYIPGAGRRKSELIITLGPLLLPNYVFDLKLLTSNRRDIRLVPVLKLPPLIGRHNEHGPQAAFQMLIVAYMRDNARDLVNYGGVYIPPKVLNKLAQQSSLPVAVVPHVIDRWLNDGDDGPAVLKRISGEDDRYTLGDAYELERKFMEAGAYREIGGSKGGQKSVTAKAAQLKRYTTTKKRPKKS